MDNIDSKLVRPDGDPRVPCFAILGVETSELKLVDLEGGSSSSVEISDNDSHGIVTIDGEVFVVTSKEILKLHNDGTKTIVCPLPRLLFSRFISFQKKIYIIQHGGRRMLCFDPADNSLTDDLPGCGLGGGFCASATDNFIYTMGGWRTLTKAMKFDPLTRTWAETAPMRKTREDAAAATLDGKIYVMGGLKHGASVEYYNPGNNSWTEISNMNAHRHNFIACVVGDQLYAVGGDGEYKNGFYQHSIEVYDKNKWTVATKFQTKGDWTYSCIWPHGSHQPDSIHPNDMPKSIEKTYSLLRSENFVEAKRKIRSTREKIEYAGCKINLSEGALREEKEVTVSAHVGVDQKKGMPDITPTFECNPPLTFEKPVSMTMRTCISAPAGKEIPVSLLTRDHPGEEWKETQQLSLGQRNEVKFEIQRFSGIKVAAQSSNVKIHSISCFHINLKTRMAAVTFSKDQAVHDAVEKSMSKKGFVDFSLISHDVQGRFGSEISVSMERKEPKDITVSKAYPSPTFALDEDYLQRGKHIVYFVYDPEPSDQCRMISMEYGYKVDGEFEQLLPLRTEWVPKDTKPGPIDTGLRFGDGASVILNDCNFNIQGGEKATSAVGFDLGAQATVNIKDGNIDVHAGTKDVGKSEDQEEEFVKVTKL